MLALTRASAWQAAVVLGTVGSWAVSPTALAAGPSVQQCIAANEGAQDLQAAGKLREARVRLSSCESTTCPGPVREDCARRLDALDRAMPTVVFLAKDVAGNEVSAVRVAIDGVSFAERLDGRALPVDLGEHVFRFDGGQGAMVTKTLVIHEGEKDRREVVLLGEPAAAPAGGPAGPGDAHPEGTDRGVGNVQRKAGLALGAGGVAGLALGAILGLVAKSTYDSALQQCPEGPASAVGCGTAGHDRSLTARGDALASTVAFVAGGVLAAGGALLYFTAPRPPRAVAHPSLGHRGLDCLGVAPVLSPGGATLRVEGAW